MSEFPGFRVIKAEPAGRHDEKSQTYEWCKGIPGRQVSIYIRKKGLIFGNHYHKGEDPSKNPEKHFLIEGRLKIWVHNGLTGERGEFIVEGPCEIVMEKNIYHKYEALTDLIFIEYRPTKFDENNPDTYPGETYEEYIKSLK